MISIERKESFSSTEKEIFDNIYNAFKKNDLKLFDRLSAKLNREQLQRYAAYVSKNMPVFTTVEDPPCSIECDSEILQSIVDAIREGNSEAEKPQKKKKRFLFF